MVKAPRLTDKDLRAKGSPKQWVPTRGHIRLISGLFQESSAFRPPQWLALSSRDPLLSPHHNNLVNTQGLYYTSDESAKFQGMNVSLELLTYQNLYTDSLPLDRLSPWERPGLRLFWREVIWRYGVSIDRVGDVHIMVGRQVLKVAQRRLIGDGIRLQSRHSLGGLKGWELYPEISMMKDRSAIERLSAVERASQQDELWGRVGLSGAHRWGDGTLSMGGSVLRALEESGDEGFASRLYTGLLEWSSPVLWGRGEVALSDQYDLSQASVISGGRSASRDLHLDLSADYRAGDEWDQRWIPGTHRPLVLESALYSASARLSWNQAQGQMSYSRGEAPSWHAHSLSIGDLPEEGEAWRMILHWGSIIGGQSGQPLYTTAREVNQERVSGQGLSLRFTHYQLRRGATRWGHSPWTAERTSSQDQLSALSAGWSLEALQRGKGGLIIGALMSVEPQRGLWWPELELSWRGERFRLSGSCGRPLDTLGILAPNYWHTRCGVQLYISSPVER